MPAHDNLRIRSNEIRPLRRNRANGYIIDTEQQTLPIAVVPLTYARELLATERMKRMRYPHKTRGCVRITCISNGGTSDLEEGTYAVPLGAGTGERRREITVQEWGALLSGIDLKRATQRKRYRRLV